MVHHLSTLSYQDIIKSSGNSSGKSDFAHCVAKNTLNGNGFMGARGDIATVRCIIDRKADRAAANISGVSAGDGYDPSYPSRTSGHHSKAESCRSLIKDTQNGTSSEHPLPSGYLSMFDINFQHSHPIPNGCHYSGAYISNASMFYYDGLHNSVPTYIGRNGVRYWARCDGVYEIGQGFTEGEVEKYNGMTQNTVRNTYKCKTCGQFFDSS